MSGLSEDPAAGDSQARYVQLPEEVGARSKQIGWFDYSVATVRDGKSLQTPVTAVATRLYQRVSRKDGLPVFVGGTETRNGKF